MEAIFETERLTVRKLILDDLEPFHEMQGNENVMRFVRGKPMTYQEDKAELEKLVNSYDKSDNDFWIFAIERKHDTTFVGTIAMVKSDTHGETTDEDALVLNIKNTECEIGYRLLEKYWGNGYAKEIARGLVNYAQKIGFKRLIACVAYDNPASVKILEHLKFQFMKDFVADDLKIPEKKLALYL